MIPLYRIGPSQAVSTASSELLVTKMAPIDAGADGNAEAVRVSLWANQTLLEADINTNVTNLKVNELQVREHVYILWTRTSE